ncbi:ATP-binding cassette sub-family C member 9 [Tolypocladium ophioglossoides CBS 100239]|uniref:ATP-binding cassette sub-family C member 9 n=1 Tax=Tolypocladium ophioglossoides (strain CBS 100239) TaxID=1163406 RepID=A0A0L0MWZ0_TOLOC|nr:ATP-binding cassette sub-family C member 9 [Tolypocladium ophioglossoides CBS 100239]
MWYRKVLWACALEEDVAQLENGDQSLVGSAGIALSGGQKQRVALARAVYTRASVVLLDDVFSALDRKTSLDIFRRLLGDDGLLRKERTTILLATHLVEYLPSADSIIMLGQSGTIVERAANEELRMSEEYLKTLRFEEGNDQLIRLKGLDDEPAADKPQGKGSAQNASASELTRKTGDLSLYKFYLNSVGPLLSIGWLVLAAGYIFSGRVPQIWLRVWTKNGTTNHAVAYFGGYLGFGFLCALFSGACIYYFMIIVIPKSAQHLHRLLLDGVLRAPLWFFTTTDLSTILNRFSQDMTLVDQVLPMAAFTTTFDLEAKSPLYRQFTETATGIITVRAFGWKQELMNENLQHLEHSQKPYYMMYCIQRWLNVVLDVFVAAIAIVLVGFALGFSNTATQGSIGLALLNLMEFNQSLSMLINSWTGLETSLGAIARLKSFLAETKAEGLEMEDETPPSKWPQRGSIRLTGVTAKYNIGDVQSRPALQNVDLELRPGQNVLIIGRTGSGKSSLILTLLHLLDLESGRITIDGLDMSRIPRQTLRSRIVTIPQDPVELPGSVRYNLTLFSSSGEAGSANNDKEEEGAMKHALTRVGLWDTVSKRGGLDGELDDVGLSGGQKQLFSLARALLAVRNRQSEGGIVLLDEPTSGVDVLTDVDMRRIVREGFAGYTIVTVSHRLAASSDADVVVRIIGGKVAEVTRNSSEVTS